MENSILDTLSGEKPLKVQVGISPLLTFVLVLFAIVMIVRVSLNFSKP